MKAYTIGAALALLIALGWYAHHSIYTSGFDAGEVEGAREGKEAASAALAELDRKERERAGLADALATANDAVRTAKERADQQQAAGKLAVDAALVRARDADRTLQAWMSRYAAAARDPDCARILEEPVCAAASDY